MCLLRRVRSPSGLVDCSRRLGVHTVCAELAVVVDGSGGCVVAELLAVHIVVLTLTGGQILVGLHLAIGIELQRRSVNLLKCLGSCSQ